MRAAVIVRTADQKSDPTAALKTIAATKVKTIAGMRKKTEWRQPTTAPKIRLRHMRTIMVIKDSSVGSFYSTINGESDYGLINTITSSSPRNSEASESLGVVATDVTILCRTWR